MKLSNETIRDAVKEWLDDEKTAKAKYGHISNWDTSEVTDMSNLFENYSSFNQPIGDWDVNNVTNMSSMFDSAKSFNQPIGDWDVSNVTDMSSMFEYAESFNQPIGDWDVNNVTNMLCMFYYAESFNQPIGRWNVSNDTDTNAIVEGAKSFNQPIGDWDVSIVEDIDEYESDGIYLMTQGSLFTYLNDKQEEMTFEAFELIVECPDAEDYEWEVKNALGELVFTEKGDHHETYLITDLPEDIVDCEFTNSVGNLHNEPLNSIDEAVEFIKNLKTISFKEINPKDGESIRYID